MNIFGNFGSLIENIVREPPPGVAVLRRDDKCADPNHPDRLREWLERRAAVVERIRALDQLRVEGWKVMPPLDEAERKRLCRIYRRDPDGDHEPLPVKAKPKRVIPDVPATTYAAMLRGLV